MVFLYRVGASWVSRKHRTICGSKRTTKAADNGISTPNTFPEAVCLSTGSSPCKPLDNYDGWHIPYGVEVRAVSRLPHVSSRHVTLKTYGSRTVPSMLRNTLRCPGFCSCVPGPVLKNIPITMRIVVHPAGPWGWNMEGAWLQKDGVA